MVHFHLKTLENTGLAEFIFEYDKEEEEKKLRKAEFEAGYNAGITQEKKVIIQLMFNAGEPVEKIARYIGYTVEEIKEEIRKFSK